MTDLATPLLAFLPSLLYAIGGIIDARNKSEKIRIPVFLKTLIIGALSAGLIGQTQADLLTQLASTTIVTYIFDKLINALMKKA